MSVTQKFVFCKVSKVRISAKFAIWSIFTSELINYFFKSSFLFSVHHERVTWHPLQGFREARSNFVIVSQSIAYFWSYNILLHIVFKHMSMRIRSVCKWQKYRVEIRSSLRSKLCERLTQKLETSSQDGIIFREFWPLFL